MSKHTPGPWRICKGGNMSNLVEGPSGVQIDGTYDDGYRTVAMVQSCCSDRGARGALSYANIIHRTARLDANLRLIAAAPDLLAALELVMAWRPSAAWPELAALEAARSALSKAKGETT